MLHRHHILQGLATLLVLATALPAFAGTYTDRDTKSFSEEAATKTFEFTSLPAAKSKVSVGVDLWGPYKDEKGIARHADVDLDGVRTERMCDSGCTSCTSTPNSANFQVKGSSVDDGTFVVTVDNSENVLACRQAKTQIRVRIEYETNEPPVAEGQQIRVEEDTSIEFLLTASDPDGDSLTYNVAEKPEHGALSGNPPQLTYTPDEDYNGPDRLTFVAYDGAATSDPAEIGITVKPFGDPPEWITPEKTRFETPAGEPFEVQARAVDPDGDDIEYGTAEKPPESSIEASTGAFEWHPTRDDLGTHQVVFTATDGRNPIDKTIEIEVLRPDGGFADAGGDTAPDARPQPEYDVRGGGCSAAVGGQMPLTTFGAFASLLLFGLLRRREV